MRKGCAKRQRKPFVRERSKRPFESIADLAYRVPELRRNELVLLASIGALNSIGHREEEDLSREFRTCRAKRERSSVCIAAMLYGRWSARHVLPARCWRAFRNPMQLLRWRP